MPVGTSRLAFVLLILLTSLAGQALAGVNRWSGRGPEGASITTLTVDPTRPGTVYAGTESPVGVVKTVNGGETWVPAAEGLDGAAIWHLLVDPLDANRLYAAAFPLDGRAFRSTDGAGHWETMPVGAPVWSLAASSDGSQTILYAVMFGGGVSKSLDGGSTWIAAGADVYGSGIFVDPVEPDTVYISGETPSRRPMAVFRGREFRSSPLRPSTPGTQERCTVGDKAPS